MNGEQFIYAAILALSVFLNWQSLGYMKQAKHLRKQAQSIREEINTLLRRLDK